MNNQLPIIQIVGYKNRGKTTVISKLISYFSEKGYKVGTVKHDAHDFEMDIPKTDSWKHRQSGAHTTAIVSSKKTAWIQYESVEIDHLLLHMHHVDLVIIEGFKYERYPKIVLVQTQEDLTLVQECSEVIAIATWIQVENQTLPVFDINDVVGICAFIEKWYTFNKNK